MLEMERSWGNRTASSEENGFCFVNIDLKFPSGKIRKQYGRCIGEPVNYGVSSPRVSKNGDVIGITVHLNKSGSSTFCCDNEQRRVRHLLAITHN